MFPDSPLEDSKTHHSRVDESGETPSSNRNSRSRSRHILSRDHLAHVVMGDRTSPSRDPLYCLDPVKFSPPERSGKEQVDPRKRE